MQDLFIIPKTGDRRKQIDAILRTLLDLPRTHGWCVAITEQKHKRSLEQNAYLWGVVYPAILQGGGETLGGWRDTDLHEYFLGEWSGWDVIDGFGYKRKRPRLRSSKLSKSEFMDYVAFIQQKMAELGIVIPDSNDLPESSAP